VISPENDPSLGPVSAPHREAETGPSRLPLWLRLAPFFLGASLYVSLFLAILAPVPLAWLNHAAGRRLAFLATLTNSLLIWALASWSGLLGFVILVVCPAWAIAEAGRYWVGRRRSAQARLISILFAGVMAVAVGGVGALLAWSVAKQVTPAEEVRKTVEWLGEQMSAQAPAGKWDAAEWEAQKEQWIKNLPSSLAIAALLQSWIVLTLMIRLNPAKFREKLGVPLGYLRGWKTPEFWIWPTLAFGFAWVMTRGWLSDLAWNGLKFCLALYALQGVAIVSVVCDVWGIRGFGRVLVFFLVLGVMTPLLLAMGFFDLWFDFRSKLRQT
jgi:hypothetical protein